MTVWLIGAGLMAQEYAKVLRSLGTPFEVIGRGHNSATSFTDATGYPVRTGGLLRAINGNYIPEKAIVAVGVEHLAAVTIDLINAGVKRILIEKPAGIGLLELKNLEIVAAHNGACVLLAYNRRFYGSVQQVRKCVVEDGGILSAQFEFTEWSHIVASLAQGTKAKERWLLCNSTHVIDLAFHLIGRPIDWKSWTAGSTEWHPSGARFAGAGVSDKNILFSYIADWQAPGRWGLELMTRKRRLILRPLEQLHVIKIGSTKIEIMEPEDTLDQQHKPGLYRQTRDFLCSNDDLFCTLAEHVKNVEIYYTMAHYQ